MAVSSGTEFLSTMWVKLDSNIVIEKKYDKLKTPRIDV
jgi:hypothetical protein